ncbi:RNA-binding protein, putative [Bodo saltans]|uniref:RNA-binding protein, putative n=1 Tax=Bodo saltans TaxID=75058 RepID=A0A0S4JT34_BODSA|nr:RNA-binding protein, putative [Bodo saltans]|eukprot:CUG93364.1 RNA-binding protein, putative [Bodo saltans]
MPPKAAAAPAKAPAAKVAAKAAPAPKAAAPAAKAAAPAAAAPKKAAAATSNSNGVYVKNWGQGSVADATAAFSAAGKVSHVQIRRGKYALVFFENSAAVKKAVDSFNGKEVNGTTVIVTAAKTAPKTDKHDASSVVFVGPIFRENTTRKQLFEFFAGSKIVKLRRYEHNYAYVYLDSAATAQKVIKEKNGATFHGKVLTVKPSTRSLEQEKARNEHSKQLIEIHAWKQSKAATH